MRDSVPSGSYSSGNVGVNGNPAHPYIESPTRSTDSMIESTDSMTDFKAHG